MCVEQLHIRLRIEDGSLWATVEEYPGVFATGDTPDELRDSLAEGIALHRTPDDQPLPRMEVHLHLGERPCEATATAELVPA